MTTSPSSFLFAVLVLCCCSYASAQGFTVGPSPNPLPVLQSSIWTIGNLSVEMYDRWYALDAAYDPQAVFAVAYLWMTHSTKKLVESQYFDDGDKMVAFVMNFAGRYIYAFDEWEAGRRENVSAPWTVYFNACEGNHSDTMQDLTMGMNAHINYDLPIATYQSGYAVKQWRNDYYHVNDLMAMVDDSVTHSLGRYDAQFYNTDFLSEVCFQGSIDFVTSWRTSAYATAVSYQAVGLSPAVPALQRASEASVAAAGAGMGVPYPYDTAPSRIAYCEANHYPLVL